MQLTLKNTETTQKIKLTKIIYLPTFSYRALWGIFVSNLKKHLSHITYSPWFIRVCLFDLHQCFGQLSQLPNEADYLRKWSAQWENTLIHKDMTDNPYGLAHLQLVGFQHNMCADVHLAAIMFST